MKQIEAISEATTTTIMIIKVRRRKNGLKHKRIKEK